MATIARVDADQRRPRRAEPGQEPGLGIGWDFEAIERLTAEGSYRDLRLA
jgi:hypothetical protein